MTWRQLRVLIQHLPPESASMTALRNELSDEEMAKLADEGEPERGRWSQQEQLLAVIVDHLAAIQHLYTCTHMESRAKWPPAPTPTRRPGAKPNGAKTPLSEAHAEQLFEFLRIGAA